MKIVAYDGTVGEKIVRLKLVEEDGDVDLRVVDDDGHTVGGGLILCITARGKLHLYKNIDSELGLLCDKHGRIMMDCFYGDN